jgi:hypothetical protein
MRIALRRWTALLPLLAAVLSASCTAGRAPESAAARPPSVQTEAASRLAPSNATFDLEQQGLKLLWPQELGQLTDNRRLRDIYVAGETVVVEAAGGEVHCLDSSTGVWKGTAVLVDALELPPAALGAQTLFVVHNSVYAFDMAADRLAEPYHPGFALSQPPAVRQGDVFLLGANGHVVKVLEDGDRELLASLDAPFVAPPVFEGERLYASASGDQVIALDLSTGEPLWLWEPNRPSQLTSGVAVRGGLVFVGDDRGFLYGLNAEHAGQAWKTMFEAPVVGEPRLAGSRLLVPISKPAIVCVETEGQKAVVWRYEGASEVLTVGAETAYLLAGGPSVVAVALEDGEELWRERLPANCKVKGDPARPVLYVANTDGSIIAVAELDWYPPR